VCLIDALAVLRGSTTAIAADITAAQQAAATPANTSNKKLYRQNPPVPQTQFQIFSTPLLNPKSFSLFPQSDARKVA